MKSRVFVIAALSLSAAIVFAQGAGPTGQGVGQGSGQGPGQGRQGGRGGQGRMGMQRGGFGQNELALVMRKDVQADLGVSAEQAKKLEEFVAKQREARRAERGPRGGAGVQGGAGGAGGAQGGQQGGARQRNRGAQGGNFDPAAMQERMAQQRAEMRKALAEILNEGQIKRLDEIGLQLRGNRALMSPETQKALGFTAAQGTQVQQLLQKQRDANRTIGEKLRNQEISAEEARASREKNESVLDEELLKLLSAEQKAKFEALKGKPFKADPNENPRGRGGA
jgi:hypothetical protein